MKTAKTIFSGIALLLLLLNSIAFTGCKQTDSQEEQSAETAATTPQADAEAPATAAPAATSSESPVGTRPAYVPPKATQNPLTLGVSNQRVKSGAPLCLDIQVADFDQLLSMQYSVKWDPTMLKFKSVQNFQLPGLGPEDFGAHRAAEGTLTSVWIDENLQGVTVADGATIYQICYDVVGASGKTTEVMFSDGPTPFEVVNLKEEVVDIKGVAGRVTIN
ncbi:hypothetical protein [Flavilitoribacter nigricans]|uniref:Cohesin domain-containing protein n=1 Tax=Flavilitoribacter nigricans (strain ATCC 23147 / DSM 23189 / NBRC 102662 / NCIMB 1420 / SS-2) TaxID=1122177 RepID=A0A2D0N9W9_FLAN2|nr:hypothetical protein [Flavilitoribacter nigricans]PHN04939.1 hypothetical protein CRP01_18070 [Flavilitoribacter nigricans DSM 23189 = NBRC 102662]